MNRSGWISVLAFLGLSCLIGPLPGRAQENDAVKLEEVVVTATKTEKDVEDAPGSVSVVTQDELEKRNVKSIDEAINTIPGVYNPRNIKGGIMDSLGNGGFTMRGVPGASRALFMMDGVVLNDSYSGSQNDIMGIAPENIERIEVVRGPFSSLYGGYVMRHTTRISSPMRKWPMKSTVSPRFPCPWTIFSTGTTTATSRRREGPGFAS